MSRSPSSKVKVVGQGHRVTVKVVWGVFYPIDSREVLHGGVFILKAFDLMTFDL